MSAFGCVRARSCRYHDARCEMRDGQGCGEGETFMPIRSYRDLEIYQMAHKLAVEIHRMTLKELPKFELFEEATQIRRSSKSISTNIVEGFGRRRYKSDYLRFLVYAHASADETMEHLNFLTDCGSLVENRANYFRNCYDVLGRKISRFIEGVEREHRAGD